MGLFRISFLEELKVQVTELRYSKGKLSTIVLLPAFSADNLKGLEEVNLPFSHLYKIFHYRSSGNSTLYHLPS